MILDFHVEEPSVKAALEILVPRILSSPWCLDFHIYQGKQDLLKKLPAKLRAYHYARYFDAARVVIIIDEDRQDCRVLKSRMERSSSEAGVATKSHAQAGRPFEVLNRIAVEELEAWFLGDPDAVVSAYPNVPRSFAKTATFRIPDQIRGGTCEQLERLLQRYGYYKGGMPKTEVATRIATFMNPEGNTSTSFRQFVRGLQAISA